MTSARTIVVARPAEESADIIAAIMARGYTPLIEPVLAIEPVAFTVPSGFSPDTPLIFTSANGVRAFAAHSEMRANPIYTVGRNTAEAARNAGFLAIQSADGDVIDLAHLLSATLSNNVVMPYYVRAEHVSKDLKVILADKSINITEIIAYRSVSAPNIPLKLLASLDRSEVTAIMLFSSKGGQTLADFIRQHNRANRMRTVKALCISPAVLKSVSVLPFGETLVAASPDRYGMIGLLDRLTLTN